MGKFKCGNKSLFVGRELGTVLPHFDLTLVDHTHGLHSDSFPIHLLAAKQGKYSKEFCDWSGDLPSAECQYVIQIVIVLIHFYAFVYEAKLGIDISVKD